MTYAGASSRLTPDRGLALPAHWAWQVKHDGCYATATTDRAGRIASVTSRNDVELPEGHDLLGTLAGPPLSVLVGELEAHTEAGVAAASARGYRALHLFDCLAVRGVSIATAPYLTRYQWLRETRDDLATSYGRVIDAKGSPHATIGGLFVRDPDRTLPIVPLVRSTADARELWREVEVGRLEGLVAVDLRAPAGRGKRKIKLTDTAECRVIASSGGVVRLTAPLTSQAGWRGGTFLVQSVLADRLAPGAIVEVAHDGCYRSGLPRFPRVLRERVDLSSGWRRIAA